MPSDFDLEPNPAPPVQRERAKVWAKTLREYADRVIEGETQYVVAAVEPPRNRSELNTWFGSYQVYTTDMPSVGDAKVSAGLKSVRGVRGYRGYRDFLAAHLATRRVALELTKHGVSLVGGKTVRAWVFSNKSAAMSFAGMLANTTDRTATLVAGVVRPEFHAEDPAWHEEMFGHGDSVSEREFISVSGQGDQIRFLPGRIILRYWTGPMSEISRMAMRLWSHARTEWRRRDSFNVYVPLAIYRGKVQPSEPEVIRSILENTITVPDGSEKAPAALSRVEEDIKRRRYTRAEDYLGMSVADAMFGSDQEFYLGGDFGLQAPHASEFPGFLGMSSLRA